MNQVETSSEIARVRIIAAAESLFKKYGIRSVLMDDIAKELSMSKRTLYQIFETKDDIVMAVVSAVMENHQSCIQNFKKRAANSVQHLAMISEYFKSEIMSMNPVLFFDLKKFYPNAWAMYRFHKENTINCDVVSVLRTGIEEGLFWPDIDCEVMGKMRTFQIEMAFDTELFPQDKFDVVHVQMQLFEHFIRGICTPAGLELYQHYKTKQ